MSASARASDARRLRRFGTTVAIGCTMIGGISWWRGHSLVPLVLWTSAALVAAPALMRPAWLAPVEKCWLALGARLAWINTRIILTAVFYLVVTPIGTVVRLFFDPLDRRMLRDQTSYWTARTQEPFQPDRYRQQF
jgi:hypothetical protein